MEVSRIAPSPSTAFTHRRSLCGMPTPAPRPSSCSTASPATRTAGIASRPPCGPATTLRLLRWGRPPSQGGASPRRI